MALHDIVTKGSTNRSVTVHIMDSTDGTPETGVVWNTSGIDLWYRREGAAVSSITEATLASLTTAHTDGGFLHISNGDYRLDLPDAAFATGAEYVDFGGTVTGMIVVGGRVRLTDIDLEDATRGGMTALPNANAEAAGGLIVSTLGTTDADDCLTATSVNLNAGAITDASLAGNMEIVFETDFATNYNTTRNAWSTNVQDTVGTGTLGLNDLSAAEVNAEVDTGLTDFWTSPATLVDLVWDEVLTGGTHNVVNSAGRRLRQIEAAFVLHSGTAQAATSNTITLDAGANANNDFYNHAKIVITENTGVEQERIIVDYNGTTKVAKIAPPWITTPDNTSVFEVEPALSHAETGWVTIKVGLAAAATSTTITLDSDASAVDDYYNEDIVHIDFGTGEGQSRIISDYNGTTKVATVSRAWTTTPDTTSEYIVEEGICFVEGIGLVALASINAEVDTALTDYDAATGAEIATAQADLDIITGADGVNLLSGTQASIDAIEADTNELQSDDVPGLIAALPTAVENRQEMDSNSTQLAAIVLDTGTTLPGIIDDLAVKKNATFSNFEFLMVLASDGRTPATGLTVTGQRSIDGAAFASVSGTIAEVSNGIYQFDALVADTNGDVITWRFSSATADDTFVTFKTVA